MFFMLSAHVGLVIGQRPAKDQTIYIFLTNMLHAEDDEFNAFVFSQVVLVFGKLCILEYLLPQHKTWRISAKSTHSSLSPALDDTLDVPHLHLTYIILTNTPLVRFLCVECYHG